MFSHVMVGSDESRDLFAGPCRKRATGSLADAHAFVRRWRHKKVPINAIRSSRI